MADLYSGRKRRNVDLDRRSPMRRRRSASACSCIILATLLWNGFGGLSLDVFTKNTAAARRGRRPPELDRRQHHQDRRSASRSARRSAFSREPISPNTAATRGSRSSVRFINDILLSAPSIVVGLFIYELLVVPVGHFSALAGGVALAVLGAPIMVRTTEDMLNLVPNQLREAASALGMPRSLVIRHVAYKAVRSGIITGVLLAIARMTGETAPLIFTALGNSLFTLDPRGPMSSLPLIIYEFARSPYAEQQKLAWTGALILTFAVLALSIIGPRALRADATEVSRGFVMNERSRSTRRGPAKAPNASKDKVVDPRPQLLLRQVARAEGSEPRPCTRARSRRSSARRAAASRRSCGCSTACTTSIPGQRAEGEVLLDGENILSKDLDLNLLRSRVGMVFQKPTPFPMTIYDNIAFGVRLYEKLPKSEMDARVEVVAQALRAVERGEGQAAARAASASPAASSSACASPARWRSARR